MGLDDRDVTVRGDFDVGETIVDETREYGTWADWLGVPRHTFSAMFGAVIAQGRDYREVFQRFRPGFDLRQERERRAAVGQPESFGEENLYPDARPCLKALRDQGLLVGLAGNQTARAETILRSLDLPVDVIATSDGWGVEKPEPGFFQRIVSETACPPDQILYVGDRLDNDIRPARQAGMRTAFIKRGPWGFIWAGHPELEECTFRLDSLTELPDLVAQLNR
ncbi:HAD family hydrolase [Carbonactinospora thermoautotrophica]|uniref:HAD-superfamily hydrolase n=1 Tax=Carbonactinospora thermoautotrophica TaxID=1469144 RepID=A0A132MYB3_9ACTN|nr:HAD family hydrolase [Carbonactinospora thermoautotrophica]KWX02891.1 HAD-superfamily hydrolase [Carbonactinospora thermoautotrophica]